MRRRVVASEDGSIVLETTVETEPAAIAAALAPYANRLRRVGHEAGALSPLLHRELQGLGLPMVLLETRHAHGVLKAQRNKTDKNDARGLAQIVRSGWCKVVHVKSETSHRLKYLLAGRRLLKRKLLDIENEIRQSLKAFGVKLGPCAQRFTFADRVRQAVAHDLLLTEVSETLLRAWSTLVTSTTGFTPCCCTRSARTSSAGGSWPYPASAR